MAGKFFRQLSAEGYVLDVRPGLGQRDQARRTGRAPQELEPCVLLLSRSCDAELDAVGRLLGQVGVTAARIDADELATVDLLIDPDRSVVRLNGTWLAPTVTWSRHFSSRAIEHAGIAAGDLFCRDSWQAVAGQLSLLSTASMGAQRIGLLEQRSAARQHQIATPRTIITTDPGQARDLLDAERLVIKAVDQHFIEATPGRLSGVFPVVVQHAEPEPAARPGVPVIVQEYVEHDAEFRVYYIDGEVLGFEVDKEAPASLWLAADRVRVWPVDLPGPVVSAARRLAASFVLRFGAFDFLLRDGAPVFLEVNPDGDWRWAEEKAGTGPVTMAVARMIRRLHQRAHARQVSAGERSAASFNLIKFLSPGSLRMPSLRA